MYKFLSHAIHKYDLENVLNKVRSKRHRKINTCRLRSVKEIEEYTDINSEMRKRGLTFLRTHRKSKSI